MTAAWVCRCCGKKMTVCKAQKRRADVRDLVYGAIVTKAEGEPAFKRVIDPIGFLLFMTLVDGITDSIFEAHDSIQDPERAS